MKTADDLPKEETCPYCGNVRKIPLYALAHWNDLFTVTCAKESCGKKYRFFQGKTAMIARRRKP